MTPKFNRLLLESIENEISQAAKEDIEKIKQSGDSSNIQELKGLYTQLATLQKQLEKVQKAVKASANVEKRQDKIDKGTGFGKNLQRAGFLGGAGGATISGNAIYKIFSEIEGSIAKIQEYFTTVQDFTNSSLLQKANSITDKLKGLLGGSSPDIQSTPSLPDVDFDSILQNMDMAKFGVMVIGISYTVYFLGKIIQWVERKYHKSRLKTDRKKYFQGIDQI